MKTRLDAYCDEVVRDYAATLRADLTPEERENELVAFRARLSVDIERTWPARAIRRWTEQSAEQHVSIHTVAGVKNPGVEVHGQV